MSNIVEEIVDAGKTKIQALLPTFNEVFYANDLSTNECDKLGEKFGFLPKQADFVEGGSMGFTTMNHNFEITLTDQALSKDDDATLQIKTNQLYEQMHVVLASFQKGKLILATPTNCVTIISGSSFDPPEILGDNEGVALRLNIVIQYRFKNT